jgi:uncharacterized protein YjbJ (UPF0337 family)/sporulation protein YlmC with PRC-barrel domain
MANKPTSMSASKLTGENVRNHEGEKLGHIEDMVIDLEAGQVAYAVIASGGFLGLGDKYFAVPWDMLTVDPENDEIVVDISMDSLRNAPGLAKDHWPDVSNDDWMDEVYRSYGHDPSPGLQGEAAVNDQFDPLGRHVGHDEVSEMETRGIDTVRQDDWKESEMDMDNSQLKWEGRWEQLKGRIKQTWGNLTDDDIDVAEGNYQELIGRLKERTGETQEEIEQKLGV